MKNIGIVFLVMTIFGFANPLISSCSKKSNEVYKNNCIYQKINSLLAEGGLKLVGGKIIENTIMIKDTGQQTYVIIEVYSSSSEKVCRKDHKRLDKELRKKGRFKSILRDKNRNGICSVRAVGFITDRELQNFKVKYPGSKIINKGASPRKNNQVVPRSSSNIDIVSSPSNKRKIISSNINSMCIELQQNYDKFNHSNVEPRIIEKARRAYNECMKNQKDLRKLQ